MSEFLCTTGLPEEYQQLTKSVRDFTRAVVAPVAAQHDADHTFPYDVVAGMGELARQIVLHQLRHAVVAGLVVEHGRLAVGTPQRLVDVGGAS